jgi:hypothetical protein
MTPIHPPLVLAALTLSALVAAQSPPTFSIELLGSATGAVALNNAGEVVGSAPFGLAAERAWVAAPGRTQTHLPLPPGRMSSRAYDINELGVIAGVVSSVAYADPSFGGVGALWTPNGAGGYTVQELGRLPGDIGSAATALNDIGDVVGHSQGSQYRRAVLFTATGVLDLTPTGAFDPKGVNNQRLVVCYAQHCSRLDLNTLVLQDLGVPPGSFNNVLGSAINEAGQVSATAIVSTSTSCIGVAARYTDGVGWETYGSCGPHHGAASINARGDLTMLSIQSPYPYFEGIGNFALQPQIVTPNGTWLPGLLATGLVNDTRQIAITAQNPSTSQYGTVLLTPLTYVGVAVCAGDGLMAPCPCGNDTAPGAHEGCRNATGRGARLLATGSASVVADDLVFEASQVAPMSVGLLVQGLPGTPTPVYDGLLCLTAPARRLEVLTFDATGHATSASSLVAAGGVLPGDTRVYQVWYRDVGGPCGSSANVTRAVRVDWN